MIEIIVLKVTLLLLLAWTLTLALRRRSAATRHFVWCAALFGCAAIAMAALWVPPLKVRVWSASRSAVAQPPLFDPIGDAIPDTKAAALPPHSDTGAAAPVLPLLWLAGALGVIAWSAAGHIALARIARRSTAAEGYRVSDAIRAPVTWGSMILLPTESETWPAERRDAALLHERAHLARHDFLVQLAARLVCAAFWFHPLAWVALRRLRMESEHACDDRVLAAGMIATEYASHLLAVAHGALTRHHGAAEALAMARPSQFESRLVAVLDEQRSHGRISRNIAIVAASLVAIAILPIAFARQTVNVDKQGPKRGSAMSPGIDHALPASPGETLTLDLDTGASVEILGWDEPRVTVATTMGGRDAEDSVVSVDRLSNGVRVRAEYEGDRDNYSTSIHLAIRAPRKYNVKLHSAGGSLTIADLDGTFTGTTGGGNIVIDRANGSAELSTGGGEVRVTDSHLSGEITTGGGEVRLRRVTGGLDASSGSGMVLNNDDDNDNEDDRDGDTTRADDAGMHVSKAGGDIHIGFKRGNVVATTGGGDIEIGPVAGSVRASTGGGDITASLSDAGGAAQVVDVSSGAGRVEIELPANFDGRFEIQTAFTETAGPTRIDSDWELARSTTPVFDGREGTPRRYVRATGIAGSGRGLVRVKTVNGNVVLRRSAK